MEVYNTGTVQNPAGTKWLDAYTESNFTAYLKDKCVSCDNDIPPTWGNYAVRGNYCVKCGNPPRVSTKEQRKEMHKILNSVRLF